MFGRIWGEVDGYDVITFYPACGQAAIYLTLDYVDQGLGKVMPYNGFLPYEDDYYQMVEAVCLGESDEILSVNDRYSVRFS